MMSDVKNDGKQNKCSAALHRYQAGDSFLPTMTAADVNAFSALALAHIGDAVYEIMMRTALCQSGITSAAHLHKETVHRVNASAQARAANELLPLLSDEEAAAYKRGRNAKVSGIPQSSNTAEYHSATGLESLFGWLWLQGRKDRLTELFNIVLEVL